MTLQEGTETGPFRRCALSREQLPKDALIRFVASPDGEIVPDLKEKLPGRGVWITADRASVAEAAKRNAFARALKQAVKIPPALAERVGQMLNEAALSALSLANKAGSVTFGFAKIEDAIKKGRVRALVHAADAAEDGCRKLDGKYAAIAGDGAIAPIRIFTADELGLASGRTNVIHAALARGGAAENFIAAAERAQRYRGAADGCQASLGRKTDKE
ncbi:RNA-binding protein [Methyloligella sp. 2.7D]|uniref:RNA-binding protein n=1 Tax=unclassified Methyloligella TaxID=2625955 RepID=UPI00157CB8F9|nr:RNA-binding protein [Methyloligella sp. GL2]QKP78612.1 RNA-binding protein [Methyloligella sp. GL2]